MLEDLHIGTAVSASDGTRLGTLSRVIVDSPTERVVGIVVDPGLAASGNLLAPGGWERPRERVVPVDQLASVAREGIQLACAAQAFAELPLFEHEQFVAVDPASSDAKGTQGWRERFHVGDLLNYAASTFGLGGAPYLPPTEITHAEPPTAGAIGEGTPVWRLEPHEHIGAVERVLVDAATQRVSALVLRRGGVARHLVLLPASAIASIADDVVHVRLSDADLDALAPYEPDR